MKRKLSKLQIALRGVAAVSFVLVFCGGMFSLAYLLARWFYRSHQVSWSDYTVQLVNWGLGLLFIVVTWMTVGLLTLPKQRKVWNEMMDALRRIAKGDFNVVVDQEGRYDGQIGNIAQSINEMTQELKQVERLRQEFISNVSHEIQSPLTSIRGFASTLQREDLTVEERMRYSAIIEKETTRLSKLSDNLLKLTSLEADEQHLELRTFRLDTQLETIVLACEPQWLEKELELDLALAEAEIVANEELLSQVWVNLIHNAIKFTPAHGSIKLTLEQTQEHTIVCIADTGIGMTDEDRKRVFERFYKGDKQRTRTIEGSGLGLSIVQKIVDLHQGSITVESRLNEGSIFEVRLPRRAQ
ncbi:sensor histidine kinase [Paenibacillus sp. YIM B09110]|uniref:sensor histidine kinase n=1 Tax=Paenibacillus sp. YIM B09110 TaxID=3126102 RepID=UPI00301CDF78